MAEDVRVALRHAAQRMLVACQLESEPMYARTLAEVDAALTALPTQLQDAALERWQWPPIVAHAVSAVARRTLRHVVDVANGAGDWNTRRAASEALSVFCGS